MDQQRERRIVASNLKVEKREGEDQAKIIEGYAALFNTMTTIYGMFTESVKPGAFSRAITDGDDCRCLFNHDSSMVLGRTKSGTLALNEDAQGLYIKNTLPDTQLARDVYELISRGDISQQSFAFTIDQQQWTFAKSKEEMDHREILAVTLYDVGPVTYPAYEDTTIGARSSAEEVHKHAQLDYAIALLKELDEKKQGVSTDLLAKRLKLLKLSRS